MKEYILVVTFVISGSNLGQHLTITGGGAGTSLLSNYTVYHIPQPTDHAIVRTVPAVSLDAAMVVYANLEPEDCVGIGWKRGPAVVIELATGKVTRLRLIPRLVTKTETKVMQDGWTAEVEP